MVDVTQAEFEQLVGENTRRIGKTKQRVVSEDCSQPHRSGMQDCLMAQVAQTCMTMDNVDALAQHDVAEHGKK